mgnify:CR=1 FL=1
MSWYRAKRICYLGAKSLLMHKLRSGLTMLGIVFGVCSVIAMLAIGEGASQEAQAQIARLGSGNLIIKTVKPVDNTDASASKGNTLNQYGVNYDDVTRFHDTLSDVDVIVPLRRINQDATYGRNKGPVEILGTTPWCQKTSQVKVIQGRFLTDFDLVSKATVCVIDTDVYDKIYMFDEPLGSYLRIKSDYYNVVGVVAAQGVMTAGEGGESADNKGGVTGQVYIPLTTTKERFGTMSYQHTSSGRQIEQVELQQITLKIKGAASDITKDRMLSLRDVVDAMLRSTHKQNDYQIIVPLELLEQARASKRIFSIVLSAIAAISLLVGGIGIMNIMLATVSERTREIGIRRSLGARKNDIIIQFLTETIMLTFTGGIVGILLGALIPWVVTEFTGMPTDITLGSLILSFGISGSIGVLFGGYPAWRAANMDPIESLRHE